MSQVNSREVVLLAQATVTTNGTGAIIVLPMWYSGAIVHVNGLTVSGTSPTLNVYVQNILTPPAATDIVGNFPTGTQFGTDIIAFAQLTTSNQISVASLSATGNYAVLRENKALTVSTVRNGPIGSAWQVAWTVGGTSPSFAFSVGCLLCVP
jgi:hypothetical protein